MLGRLVAAIFRVAGVNEKLQFRFQAYDSLGGQGFLRSSPMSAANQRAEQNTCSPGIGVETARGTSVEIARRTNNPSSLTHSLDARRGYSPFLESRSNHLVPEPMQFDLKNVNENEKNLAKKMMLAAGVLCFNSSLDRNSRLCRWDSSRDEGKQTFYNQAFNTLANWCTRSVYALGTQWNFNLLHSIGNGIISSNVRMLRPSHTQPTSG